MIEIKKFELEIDGVNIWKEGMDAVKFLEKYGIEGNEIRLYENVMLEFDLKEIKNSRLLKEIFKESNRRTIYGRFNELADIKQSYLNNKLILKDGPKKIFYKKINKELENLIENIEAGNIKVEEARWYGKDSFEIIGIKEKGSGGFYDNKFLTPYDTGLTSLIEVRDKTKEEVEKEIKEHLNSLRVDIEEMLKIEEEIAKEEINKLEKEKEKLLKEIEELEETKEEKKEKIKEELEKEERIYRNIYYPIYTPSQLQGVLRKLGIKQG